MSNQLFAVFHNESSFEYSGESLMGIFFSQDEAETGLLKHIERTEQLIARKKEIDAQGEALRQLRFADKITPREYGEQHKQLEGQWLLETESVHPLCVLLDPNMDNWEIKPIEPGKIYFGGC